MKPESKRPISVEDLLHLKRAERPPAEFWEEFDRQLRAKQLKALVEKRPWWHALPMLLSGVTRYRVPLGAGAALALAVVAVRVSDQEPSLEPQISTPRDVAAAADPAPAPAPAVVRAETSGLEPVQLESAPASGAVTRLRETPEPAVADAAPDNSAPADTLLAAEVTAPGELSQMVALLGAGADVEGSHEPTPSARHIAANLAAVRAEEPALRGGLLGSAFAFERTPARPAVEPLQHMTPPTERRRSHQILTAMVSMASFENNSRVNERVASGIAEQQLYERARRFGAQGDRVQVKF